MLLLVRDLCVLVHAEDLGDVDIGQALDVAVDILVASSLTWEAVGAVAEELELEGGVLAPVQQLRELVLLLLCSRELLVLGLGGDQLPGGLEFGDFLGEEELLVQIWVQELGAIAILQERHQKSPVVVISDPPAIVDEAGHEDHGVKRDLLGLENEVLEHFDARVDVRVVELVGDVPS